MGAGAAVAALAVVAAISQSTQAASSAMWVHRRVSADRMCLTLLTRSLTLLMRNG